jgi:hypothetical protein
MGRMPDVHVTGKIFWWWSICTGAVEWLVYNSRADEIICKKCVYSSKKCVYCSEKCVYSVVQY